MEMKERLHHAREEFLKQTLFYHNELVRLEMYKIPKYLFNTKTNELTRIKEPPSYCEKYLLDKIEECKNEINKRFNIELSC